MEEQRKKHRLITSTIYYMIFLRQLCSTILSFGKKDSHAFLPPVLPVKLWKGQMSRGGQFFPTNPIPQIVLAAYSAVEVQGVKHRVTGRGPRTRAKSWELSYCEFLPWQPHSLFICVSEHVRVCVSKLPAAVVPFARAVHVVVHAPPSAFWWIFVVLVVPHWLTNRWNVSLPTFPMTSLLLSKSAARGGEEKFKKKKISCLSTLHGFRFFLQFPILFPVLCAVDPTASTSRHTAEMKYPWDGEYLDVHTDYVKQLYDGVLDSPWSMCIISCINLKKESLFFFCSAWTTFYHSLFSLY